MSNRVCFAFAKLLVFTVGATGCSSGSGGTTRTTGGTTRPQEGAQQVRRHGRHQRRRNQFRWRDRPRRRARQRWCDEYRPARWARAALAPVAQRAPAGRRGTGGVVATGGTATSGLFLDGFFLIGTFMPPTFDFQKWHESWCQYCGRRGLCRSRDGTSQWATIAGVGQGGPGPGTANDPPSHAEPPATTWQHDRCWRGPRWMNPTPPVGV